MADHDLEAAISLSLAPPSPVGRGATAASAAQTLAGTWCDWCDDDGRVAEQPQYGIVVAPLDERVPAVLGMRIYALGSRQLVAEQVVTAEPGGLAVAGGEGPWAGLRAGFVWGRTPTLAWSSGSMWKQCDQRPRPLGPQLAETVERGRPTGTRCAASTVVQDVPAQGACLFHAVGQTQDAEVARRLRQRVVQWVVDHWESNCNMARLLGYPIDWIESLPLQSACLPRDYGTARIGTLEQYAEWMSNDGVYGEDLELAVAAKILGLRMSVYCPEGGRWGDGQPVNWVHESTVGAEEGRPAAVGLINRDQGWQSHYVILLDA